MYCAIDAMVFSQIFTLLTCVHVSIHGYFSASGEGNGMAGFQCFHDEGALDGGDIVDRAENVEHEVTVIVHAGRHDLKHIVEFAGDIVALGHLFYVFYPADERVGFLAAKLAQLHVAEYHESAAQMVGVEYRHISPYISLVLQTAHPFIDRRGRTGDARGKFFGGKTSVALECAENADSMSSSRLTDNLSIKR